MDSSPVLVIAEAAQGYEGVPALARLLVRSAAIGRADAVKFQLVYADELATPAYQYYSLFKQLEMSNETWTEIAAEAKRNGLRLILDVFGFNSLRLALQLGAAVKLHAADFFNEPLVTAAVREARELFVSVGGIHADEIGEFISSHSSSSRKITIMFGYQAEPTRLEDNHLARIPLLRNRFPQVQFGFMDHADGDSDESGWLGALAVALGARAVEKHITLERALQMEDYVSALSGSEFARYVGRIRSTEQALGLTSLELTPGELEYRKRSVKVVVTQVKLTKGTPIDSGSLTMLRAPLDPERRTLTRPEDAIGRTPKRTILPGEPVYDDDLQ